MEKIVLVLYGAALLFILAYSIFQLNLVYHYRKARRKLRKSKGDGMGVFDQDAELPLVTIQLPVYNEMYVVERLIDAVSLLNYPPEKLEIQLLDDSTDETSRLAELKVKEVAGKGIDIKYIHRNNRKGFKAGALREGLETAKGEFIAIFDADFIPDPEFLMRSLPYFREPSIGMVQTRWGHINKEYSLLTRMQAFGLDAHFTVEQAGRNERGYFMNFNGTAGIWRKECIVDAGGWSHDTLTEDLDLSYRAQLKGWKFKYLEDVVSPAELPVVMSALKNQQFRWNKGAAENFRKMKKEIVRNKSMDRKTRWHSFFHLLNSTVFVSVFITAVLSVPILYIKNQFPEYNLIFNFSSIFLICLLILIIFYWHSYRSTVGNFLGRFMVFLSEFILFLSTAMALSFHNSIAVMEGHMGKKSSFVRTPKFNIISNGDKWQKNKYLNRKIELTTIIEGLMILYFAFGVMSAFILKDFTLLPFHLMLLFGFSFVFYLSVKAVSR